MSTHLPVSTKDRVPFCPVTEQLAAIDRRLNGADLDERERVKLLDQRGKLQDKADAGPLPVYHLAVPSLMERAAYRRDVRAAGATYPGDDKLYEALRLDLAACNPHNLDHLLAQIDDAEAEAEGAVDPQAFEKLEKVARLARALGGEFAALEGDREFWLSVAPLHACRHFLVGWENGPCDFRRSGGRVDGACLEALGEMEARTIGYRIMNMMQPSKDQEGNSESRSPSSSPPTSSPPALTAPLTEAPGNSSGSGTSETPAAS